MRIHSIATRLTIWYALLSTALIAAACCTMYWMLADRLNREDDEFLSSKAAEAYAVLQAHPDKPAMLVEELLHEGETFSEIRVRVLDAKGVLIADTPDPDNNGIPTPIFDAMPWPTNDAGINWRADGIQYRLINRHFGGVTVHSAMRLAKEERLLADYRNVLIGAVSAVLAITVAAGYAIARLGLKPAYRLAVLMEGLGAGQLTRRIGDVRWPTELRQLATNFDRLLARLDEAFSRISRFSADLAHELRTPLHILRSEAEQVLSREHSPAEYRARLESAMDEYDRMSRMVDALLFLARAEQPDAVLDRRTLDLQRELASVQEFFQARAEELGVNVTVQASGSLDADHGLLRRALANLVDNAVRHTPAGGEVMLATVANGDGSIDLSVSDNGCGIAAADLPRVTDRFYSVDRARERMGQGTGLGLAIVQSIMHLHGGDLRIASELDQGTTVVLHFPKTGAVA